MCVNLFNDTNFNSRRDTGEVYIPNIAVGLYLQSNLLTAVDTKSTNSTGDICFTGLYPNNFQIKITTTGFLNDNLFVSTTGGNTQNITLNAANNYYSTQTFGYTSNVDYAKGAFRGLVYVDRNENGIVNPKGTDGVEATVYDNDVPIVEKQVNLLKDSGGNNFVLQTTQITDAVGEFNFIGLEPGVYKVELDNDTGVTAVTPNPSTKTFTVNTNEKTYDLYGFQYTAQICPTIFLDKINDGILNGTDIDLIQNPGVYVQLEYQSFGGTQIYGGGSTSGILLNSTNPCITKVPPRNYNLKIASSNNFSGTFDTNYYNQRNPVTNPTTSIFLGNTTNPKITYYTNALPPVNTLSTIKGRVWNDRPNTNSVVDFDGTDNKTGPETVNSKTYDNDYDNDFVYPGLTVALKKCGPVSDETIANVNAWNANMPSTVTDANGNYIFVGIPTGVYAVIVTSSVPNQNVTTTLGKGLDCSYYYNYTFFNSYFNNSGNGLAPGSNVDYDVIYYFTPNVSAAFWVDTNKNGIKDGWEDSSQWSPYRTNLEMANSVGLVETNKLRFFSNGIGNYAASVSPNSYTLSLLNTLGNTNVPTEYGIIGSLNRLISTVNGSQNVEFGVDPTNNSSISGKMFIDRDGDNLFEPNGQDGNPITSFDNDIKLANKSVSLHFGAGQNQLKQTLVTDSEGNYTFTGLAEGVYYVSPTENPPPGTSCTACGTTIGLSKDTNYTQNIRYNYDGRIRFMSFYDTITNFTRQDEFETDVNEGTFTLIAPDGSQVGQPVSPVIKDSGYYYYQYQFNNLAPGNYTVQMNGMPSSLRGYLNPDTIVVSPSQSQERDYPFTALTNNSISGDVFIDKRNGTNQGFNSLYNPSGLDNNLATLFDNDKPLSNTLVTISGPLGNYNVSTNSSGAYIFNNVPSGKYKLYRLDNTNNQIPNLILDTNNPDINNISLNYWTQNSWVRNNNSNSHNFSYRYTNEISVYCYEDKDLNGQITYYPDSNTYDRRSSLCTFELEASNGEIIPLDSYTSGTSDANGIYYYTYHYKSDLPPGNYILRNTNNLSTSVVTNFIRYEPSILNYGQARQANITFSQGNLNQTSRANMFLSLQVITNNASIIGQIFIDRNENEIFEPSGADNNPTTLEDNDVALKNVKVDLSKVSPFLSKSTKTDENGNYQLTDLPSGIFKIKADLVQK